MSRLPGRLPDLAGRTFLDIDSGLRSLAALRAGFRDHGRERA